MSEPSGRVRALSLGWAQAHRTSSRGSSLGSWAPRPCPARRPETAIHGGTRAEGLASRHEPRGDASRRRARKCSANARFCEAHCGIRVEIGAGDQVLRIDGDPDDVLSHGYICPKATTLKTLHEDPQRLRTPMRRVGEGVRAGHLGSGVRRDRPAGARPAAGSTARTRSASTRATRPPTRPRSWPLGAGRRCSAAATSTPRARSTSSPGAFRLAADVRRPHAAAGGRHRPHRLPARDRRQPRRSRTGPSPPCRTPGPATRPCGSAVAASWCSTRAAPRPPASRPSTCRSDPAATPTCCSRCSTSSSPKASTARRRGLDGLDEVKQVAAQHPPASAAAGCGIDAETITRLAREFAGAGSAVAYGRLGVCHHTTGSVTHWLINVLNVVTGNLDRPGGSCSRRRPSTWVGCCGRSGARRRTTSTAVAVPACRSWSVSCRSQPCPTRSPDPARRPLRGLIVVAGNPTVSGPGQPRRSGRPMDKAGSCSCASTSTSARRAATPTMSCRR